MLPAIIPVFPLPNVVLFPGVFLPLHIFEPRYRAMVTDTLNGDRLIGMTLLRPGWEQTYDGRPQIYPVGCAGLISHVDKLTDGRYNIVLHGLQKFRITSEEPGGEYRRAHVDPVVDDVELDHRTLLRAERRKLEALLLPTLQGQDAPLPASLPDDTFVNALSQYLDFAPIEKQALLEQPSLLDRCKALVELIEIQNLSARVSTPSSGGSRAH